MYSPTSSKNMLKKFPLRLCRRSHAYDQGPPNMHKSVSGVEVSTCTPCPKRTSAWKYHSYPYRMRYTDKGWRVYFIYADPCLQSVDTINILWEFPGINFLNIFAWNFEVYSFYRDSSCHVVDRPNSEDVRKLIFTHPSYFSRTSHQFMLYFNSGVLQKTTVWWLSDKMFLKIPCLGISYIYSNWVSSLLVMPLD